MSAGRRRLARLGRPIAFTPSVSSKLVKNPVAQSRTAGKNICALRSSIHNSRVDAGGVAIRRAAVALRKTHWEAIHE